MPILSVVLTRGELGLPPLEISTDPEAATYWLAGAPAGWPAAAARGRTVPWPRRWDTTVESLAVPRPRGRDLDLPLQVLVSGGSAAELYAARTHLAAVLGQRDYRVTVSRPRRDTTHHAGRSAPRWSSAPAGPGGRRTLRASVRIPLLAVAPEPLVRARPA